MAERPVFVISETSPYYSVFNASFAWAGGFATSQKQKNIASIHSCFEKSFPGKKVLEISSKATEEWGIGASAFFLKKYVPSLGRSVPVENVFQSGKVFSGGGPYKDLLEVKPIDAKRDSRLNTSGQLVAFRFEDEDFPITPKTVFYDFIYINALLENPDIAKKLEEYDGFTDIAFNPEKSLNCQAQAAAVYVSLVRKGMIDKVKDFKTFSALLGGGKAAVLQKQAPAQELETVKEEKSLPHMEPGAVIVHKVFGKGTVVSLSGTVLKVRFDSVGEKSLGLSWVLENCKKEND